MQAFSVSTANRTIKQDGTYVQLGTSDYDDLMEEVAEYVNPSPKEEEPLQPVMRISSEVKVERQCEAESPEVYSQVLGPELQQVKPELQQIQCETGAVIDLTGRLSGLKHSTTTAAKCFPLKCQSITIYACRYDAS